METPSFRRILELFEALIDEKRALARDKDQAMLRMLEELLRRRG